MFLCFLRVFLLCVVCLCFRLRSEELSSHVDRLKRHLADLEIKLRNRDQEFESYRQQLLSQPESKLQAELSIAQLEKVQK